MKKEIIKNYEKAIIDLMNLEGIEAANSANHLALAKKIIDLDTFQAGARILAKAIMER